MVDVGVRKDRWLIMTGGMETGRDGLMLAATSALAVAVCAPDGTIADATAGVRRLLALDPLPTTLQAALAAAGAGPASLAAVAQALAGRSHRTIEIPLHSAGRERVCLAEISPAGSMVTIVFVDATGVVDRRPPLRSILDATVAGLVIHDASGRVVEANAEAARLLGLSRDQLLGLTSMDPRWRAIDIDGNDLPGDRHPASLALGTGEAQRGIVMGVDLPEGARRWLKVSAVREVDARDGTVYAIASFTDVTEEREREQRYAAAHAAAEQALLDLGAYRAALDQHAIVAITDRAGRITYANDAFCAISGYAREELIGRTHRVLKSDEQPPAFFEALWARISSGETWHGEIRNKAKDGRAYWVETSIIPLKDLKGRITSYVSIRRDITDRKAAETRLIEETAKLKAVIDNFPGGIVFAGPDLRMLGCNREYRRLLDLPDDLFEHGPPNLRDVFRFNAERGEYGPGDVEDIVEARIERARLLSPQAFQRIRPDGTVLEVRGMPVPGGGWVASYMDVTGEVRAREALFEKTRLLEQTAKEREIILAHMSDGLSVFDPDGRLIVWNLQYVKMFGLRIADVERGKPLLDLLEIQRAAGNFQGDPFAYLETIAGSVERSTTYEAEAVVNGRVIRTVHAPMPDGGWVASHEDVTEAVAVARRIAHAARHDPLTDALNRGALTERMEAELAGGEGFAVLLVDLDRFKTVNDTLGHAGGDALLKAVTERLRAVIGPGDEVARIGGDEFAVLLTGHPDPLGAARATAARIVAEMARAFDIEGRPLSLGASVGISVAPLHGDSMDQLMRGADHALYAVKGRGRNGFLIFEGGGAKERRLAPVPPRAAAVG